MSTKAHNIKTVSGRERLQVRGDPYYDTLRKGHFVGFRKSSPRTEGTWVARIRNASGRPPYDEQTLGHLDEVPRAERYDLAVKKANEWFASVGRGSDKSVKTVGDACRAYLQSQATKKDSKGLKDLEDRYKRWIYGQPIEGIKLASLRSGDVQKWRRWMEAQPVTEQGRAAASKGDPKPRNPSTVNRDLTPLRAALGWALLHGHVGNDGAWKLALLPVGGVESARKPYLDKEKRTELVTECDDEIRPFVHALSMLPLRPGAAAALRASCFDAEQKTLFIGKDKVKGNRWVPLPEEALPFFAEQCANKSPHDWMFARANGKPWEKDTWKKMIKEAAKRAGLPERTVLMSLRHSTITDLVISNKMALLTIAQVAGTGVPQIEKTYGHLIRDYAAKALSTLVINLPSNDAQHGGTTDPEVP